jgi:hypothetical protein
MRRPSPRRSVARERARGHAHGVFWFARAARRLYDRGIGNMDVRAAVAVAAGKPLEVTTVQLEGPKAFEVMVEIKATGICHTDEFTLSGGDPEGLFPSILGHEGAGIVVEVGAGVTSCGRAITSSRSTRRSAAPARPASRARPTSAPRSAPPRARD